MILTIFDFDDTLFPSAVLSAKILTNNVDQEMLEQLKRVAESISSVIEEAEKWSTRVLIVTSANRSWLKMCDKYLNCLGNKRIVSCQDFDLPGPNHDWKKIVFCGIAEQLLKGGDTLVAFGDRKDDRDACFEVMKKFPSINIKSILLDKEPSLEKLLEEHQVIETFLPTISTYRGKLDWMLIGNPVKVRNVFGQVDDTLRGK
jgi:hypothetical protein